MMEHALYLPDGRPVFQPKPILEHETAKIFRTPSKLYDNLPCNHCTHYHVIHSYLYTIARGASFSDRFRCLYRGCACGLKFKEAYEKFSAIATRGEGIGLQCDMSKADDDAILVNEGLYKDL
jgi:hypothetical protein